MLKNFTIAFTAGAIGGLVNVILLTIFNKAGLTSLIGLELPPPALPGFLYKQMVWGGLWGLLLVAPVLLRTWWLRGLLLGVAASLVALVVFFPQTPLGMFGLNKGPMMPVLVLIVNTGFGLAAAWIYERARDK